MNKAKNFLNIVDERIKMIIQSFNLISRYSGTVVSINKNLKVAKVKILGYDSIFTFPYRKYVEDDLQEGKGVFIEVKNGKMNTGIITDIYYGR